MGEYLSQTWAILQLLFLLPGLVVMIVYSLVKSKIFGLPIPDRSEEDHFPKIAVVISALAWVLLALWVLYESQFTYIEYSFACPANESVKCYELRTEVVTEDGRTLVERMYFPNGGHLSFDYCNDLKDSKVECYAESTGEAWVFQHSKTVKTRE